MTPLVFWMVALSSWFHFPPPFLTNHFENFWTVNQVWQTSDLTRVSMTHPSESTRRAYPIWLRFGPIFPGSIRRRFPLLLRRDRLPPVTVTSTCILVSTFDIFSTSKTPRTRLEINLGPLERTPPVFQYRAHASTVRLICRRNPSFPVRLKIPRPPQDIVSGLIRLASTLRMFIDNLWRILRHFCIIIYANVRVVNIFNRVVVCCSTTTNIFFQPLHRRRDNHARLNVLSPSNWYWSLGRFGIRIIPPFPLACICTWSKP